MHFSFFQSYFHFFRFDPKIRSDMTRRKKSRKKPLLTAFSRIFVNDQNFRSQYEEWMSGQINGSKTYFERVCYYALKILHVFLDVLSCFMSSEFNPFVISECQELLLLFQLKPWGDGKQHFSCSDQYFFSLSTCQSCDYSTEKLIECKWDNTNSCCVQTLIVWKSSVGDKKLDHSHLISIVHHF